LHDKDVEEKKKRLQRTHMVHIPFEIHTLPHLWRFSFSFVILHRIWRCPINSGESACDPFRNRRQRTTSTSVDKKLLLLLLLLLHPCVIILMEQQSLLGLTQYWAMLLSWSWSISLCCLEQNEPTLQCSVSYLCDHKPRERYRDTHRGWKMAVWYALILTDPQTENRQSLYQTKNKTETLQSSSVMYEVHGGASLIIVQCALVRVSYPGLERRSLPNDKVER
jgi:hypothetical protein